MIKGDGQYINVCVRGLLIQDDELVITEWVEGDSFLIGGRVDFGEALIDALHREMKEEIDARIRVHKLAYFSEHVFTTPDGREFHEYGWYFLVDAERPICPNGRVIPNPDHPQLIIRRTPITAAALSRFWPRFLRTYLPRDYATGFADCPRFLYTRDGDNETQEMAELAAALLGQGEL